MPPPRSVPTSHPPGSTSVRPAGVCTIRCSIVYARLTGTPAASTRSTSTTASESTSRSSASRRTTCSPSTTTVVRRRSDDRGDHPALTGPLGTVQVNSERRRGHAGSGRREDRGRLASHTREGTRREGAPEREEPPGHPPTVGPSARRVKSGRGPSPPPRYRLRCRIEALHAPRPYGGIFPCFRKPRPAAPPSRSSPSQGSGPPPPNMHSPVDCTGMTAGAGCVLGAGAPGICVEQNGALVCEAACDPTNENSCCRSDDGEDLLRNEPAERRLQERAGRERVRHDRHAGLQRSGAGRRLQDRGRGHGELQERPGTADARSSRARRPPGAARAARRAAPAGSPGAARAAGSPGAARAAGPPGAAPAAGRAREDSGGGCAIERLPAGAPLGMGLLAAGAGGGRAPPPPPRPVSRGGAAPSITSRSARLRPRQDTNRARPGSTCAPFPCPRRPSPRPPARLPRAATPALCEEEQLPRSATPALCEEEQLPRSATPALCEEEQLPR